MADRIVFHAVGPAGAPGERLGTARLDDAGAVVCTPGVAADTVAMLARRLRRTESDVVRYLSEDGWSNGYVMTVAAH